MLRAGLDLTSERGRGKLLELSAPREPIANTLCPSSTGRGSLKFLTCERRLSRRRTFCRRNRRGEGRLWSTKVAPLIAWMDWCSEPGSQAHVEHPGALRGLRIRHAGALWRIRMSSSLEGRRGAGRRTASAADLARFGGGRWRCARGGTRCAEQGPIRPAPVATDFEDGEVDSSARMFSTRPCPIQPPA